MTKIIDLPTTASTDANTFVPVYRNGKTQKVSATALGGGGSGLDLTSTTDVPSVEGTEYIPLNKPLGTVLRVTVQRILDWILARANTWTGVQTFNTNINFTGTGRRITGDFSNATASNRLLFQTSVGNGNTTVGAVPNGSGGASGFAAYAKSDATNSELLTAYATATSSVVAATKTGSGNFTPLLLFAGDSERLRIDAAGNVGIGTSAPANKFVVSDAGAQGLEILPSTAGVTWISSFNRATASATPLALEASILIFNAPSAQFAGAFGYGIGAGGTVTQATSKSTTVTLNKTTGFITTASTALAAGAYTSFIFNNSTITATSQIVVQATGGAVGNEYQAWISYFQAGVCVICLRNNSWESRSEVVGIRFCVIEGSST